MARLMLRVSAVLLAVLSQASLPAATFADPEAKPSAARTTVALKTKIPVDYNSVPLSEVLADIEKRIDTKIRIDDIGLDAEGVVHETPVRLQLPAETEAAQALHLVLRNLRLIYVVEEDGTITIGSQEARRATEEVVYDLEDLLLPNHIYPPDSRLWPSRNKETTQQVIDLIVTTVHPATWSQNGGDGTCLTINDRNAIVVRNSGYVQADILGLLEQLYRLQAVQIYFRVERVEVAAADWQRLATWKRELLPLRREVVAKHDEPLALKPLSTRKVLAYNGQILKLQTNGAADASLVDCLHIRPVVSEDRKQIRLLMGIDFGSFKSGQDGMEGAVLADGETILVPLANSEWGIERASEEVVPCYRITPSICEMESTGPRHATIKSK